MSVELLQSALEPVGRKKRAVATGTARGSARFSVTFRYWARSAPVYRSDRRGCEGLRRVGAGEQEQRVARLHPGRPGGEEQVIDADGDRLGSGNLEGPAVEEGVHAGRAVELEDLRRRRTDR